MKKQLKFLLKFSLFILISGIVYVCFKGPSLTIEYKNDTVLIDSIFLGEYHLGFNRIKILDQVDQSVVCEIFASDIQTQNEEIEWSNQIKLHRGLNNAYSIFTLNNTDTTKQKCELKNQKYIVYVWGNNGFSVTEAKTEIDLKKLK